MKEAWRRAMFLSTWDPDHSTGVRSSDLSNLRIALALALVYDLTHKHMDDETKTTLKRMIEYRTQAAFDQYVVNPKRALELKPYNSHGFRQAGAVTAIATLMAPVVGVSSSMILLGDPFTWHKLLALTMILASISLTFLRVGRH